MEDLSLPWAHDGACVGAPAEIFFSFDDRNLSQARVICAGCRVFHLCLDHVSGHHEYGTWAGLSEKERDHGIYTPTPVTVTRHGRTPAAPVQRRRVRR